MAPFLRSLAALSGLFWLAGSVRLAAQEPYLPGLDEESAPIIDDSLAPDPDGIPDNNAPVELPPTEQIPDLPPLLPPSDGEPAPVVPDVPGLVKPKDIPTPKIPTDPSGAGNKIPTDPTQALGVPSFTNWIKSPRQARIQSLKTGKPMLFVFMDRYTPACKALNDDLFNNEKFNNFARENLVLTFLDVPARSSGLGGISNELRQRRIEEIDKFRKFLKVRGLPTIIMFDGNGREVDRMMGYNFNRNLRPASLYRALQRIEEMTRHCNKLMEETAKRRKLLADVQGYRWWTSTAGSTLFARTVGLTTVPSPTEEKPDATEPAVEFMAEDGRRVSVALRQLQIGDREIVRRTLGPKDPEPVPEPTPAPPQPPVPVSAPPQS